MNVDDLTPKFEFQLPAGYSWMLEKGLISFGESPLHPWYFLDSAGSFRADEKWKDSKSVGPLTAFARRYDNDDIACFMPSDGAVKVVLIHGWTPAGYDVVATYDLFFGIGSSP